MEVATSRRRQARSNEREAAKVGGGLRKVERAGEGAVWKVVGGKWGAEYGRVEVGTVGWWHVKVWRASVKVGWAGEATVWKVARGRWWVVGCPVEVGWVRGVAGRWQVVGGELKVDRLEGATGGRRRAEEGGRETVTDGGDVLKAGRWG